MRWLPAIVCLFTLAAAPPKKPPASQPVKPLTEAESVAVTAEEFGLSFRVPRKWTVIDEKKHEHQANFNYDLLSGATGTLAYAQLRIVAMHKAADVTLETWIANIKQSSAKWATPPTVVTDEKATLADHPAWLVVFETVSESEIIDNLGKRTKQQHKAYIHHLACVVGDNVYTLTFNTDGAGYKARLKQLDRVLMSFKIDP